jgi:chitinase
VASEDGVWWQSPSDPTRYPQKESCPHCLNQYSAPGYCGLTQDGSKEYTVPKDSRGAPIESPPLQATLTAGETTTISFALTAHHKGHVELGVCCDAQPSQACFDSHPLTFQGDLLYGAPVDAAHPGRGYIAPRAMGNPNIGDGESPGGMGTGEYGNAMDFQMRFRLPADVSGERCLIQWRYITGNSCEMPGYDGVAWPSQSWRNAGVGTCSLPLSADGSGAPERFWNCADVKVLPSGSGPAPGPNPVPVVPVPVVPVVPVDPTPADPAPGDPAPGSDLPEVGPWAGCGGESTAGCGQDVACFSCRPNGSQSFACGRQSQWYWQCTPGTSSAPAPAPAPAPAVPVPVPAVPTTPAPAPGGGGSKAPWAACGGLSTAGCKRDSNCFSCRPNGSQSFGCTRQSEWYWQCAPGTGTAPAPGTGPTPGTPATPGPSPEPPVAGGGRLEDILSEADFDSLFPHRSDQDCLQDKQADGTPTPGGFYEYAALKAAAAYFPGFVDEGTTEQRKRELAAFLAQISHETTGGWAGAPDGAQAWGLCWKEERNCETGGCTNYCSPGDPCTANGEPVPCPCAAGKTYHGRGPMQLSWNYNYAPAGAALGPLVGDPGLDLLANPEKITSDPKLAFATAIYFWMTPRENKPSCHDVMVDKWEPTAADIDGNRLPGFGVTTNIINGGLECNIPGNAAVEDRVKYYERYSGILGVSPGQNLYCGDQRPFGQDASFALASSSYKSASGGGAAAGVVRVDKKGRTCSDLGKKACKRKRWCKFSTTTQTCEGGASDPVAATSTQITGTTAVKVDRKGRTCADFGKRKCNRKSWCAYDVTSRTCQDTGAGGDSDVAAATAGVRTDRKGRTCADFGKRKCNRKSWCAYDFTNMTCQDTGAGGDSEVAAAAAGVRVTDRKGRTCADYGKGRCQKRKRCFFNSASGACEDKNQSYLRG